MAGKPPPSGKGAALARQERGHGGPKKAPPKRVPLPHVLDPGSDTRFLPTSTPPRRTNTQSVQPGRTLKGDRTRVGKPFYDNQTPSGVDTSFTQPPRIYKGGKVQPPVKPRQVKRPVYKIPKAGAAGQRGLIGVGGMPVSPEEALAYGAGAPTPVMAALEGVVHPITDLSQQALGEKPFKLKGAASDVGNIVGNLIPGPGELAAGIVGGVRGVKLARDFVKGVEDTGALRGGVDAVQAARAARLENSSRAAVRDIKPALRSSNARAVVHGQIDMQLPARKAAAVKAALDHAAIEHGTAEAKSLKQGTLQQRRVAKAHEFYNQLLDAAGGAQHPVPGGFARYAADPEANLRQFVDQKAIDENLGAVQNDPTFSLHPQVNGHQVVGPVTPEEWWARTQHAVGGDQELGLKLAYWYHELGPMFEKFFGADAPQIIRGFAVSQANDSPAGGLQAVLRLRDKIINGEAIKPGEASVVSESIQQAIKGLPVSKGMAAKLHDFTDSLEGKTTRTWTGDDIAGGAPTAIDIHAQRDLGRIDPKILATLRERHGLPVAHLQLEVRERELARLENSDAEFIKYMGKKIPRDEAIRLQKAKIADFKKGNAAEIKEGAKSGLVLDNPGASASNHSYNNALREYAAITDHLNAIKAWGKDTWTPAETQALGWSAIQRIHGVVPEDATIAIDRNTHLISFASGTDGFSTAPDLYKNALGLDQAAEDQVRNIVESNNAFWRDVHYGLGGNGSALGPVVQLRVIASPEQTERISQQIADQFGNLHVQSFRPGVSSSTHGKFALEIESPHFNDEANTAQFWGALLDSASAKQAPHLGGFHPYSYVNQNGDTVHGIRIVTNSGPLSPEKNAARAATWQDTIDAAAKSSGYNVEFAPNNVEVKTHEAQGATAGEGDTASAASSGASGEQPVDRADAPQPVDEATVRTFDPGTDQGHQAALDEAQQWQDVIAAQIAENPHAAMGEIGFRQRGLPSEVGYKPRTLKSGNLVVRLPKYRGAHVNLYMNLFDNVSKLLDDVSVAGKSIHEVPGARLVTSTERATKQAGRIRRREPGRLYATVKQHMDTIASSAGEGTPKDVAHFWYAQLPESHRNAEGLQLVRDMQQKEFEYISSGDAADHIDAQELAIKAKLSEATQDERFDLMKDLRQLPPLRKDLPNRLRSIAASLGQLDKIIAKAPAADQQLLDAMAALSRDRERILREGGKLRDEDQVVARRGQLASALGLEPDGTESYVGHRLPEPGSFKGSYAPSSGGVGRVKSPKGVGTHNQLVLARGGRLRASTRVTMEDWHSAQVFDHANRDRQVLGAMGTSWDGTPIDWSKYTLVNPKGQTIPPHFKSDEFAQFTDSKVERDEIRQKADDMLQGWVATNPADADAMMHLAELDGLTMADLKVIPNRTVERYYQQFRSAARTSTPGRVYDMMIDATATSIIFARVGYIPKNAVQNLIMSLPHQGAFLPVNIVRAGQVMADPELRGFLEAEVQHGATAALNQERTGLMRKTLGKVTGVVTTVADEPWRVAAFLHEAAAEGVISSVKPFLGRSDKERLLALFKDKRNRPLLDDLNSRSNEAMGDFTRMTPSQAHMARRFLVIPGWLMAGTRYPFHFAATHPVRSALLAYIALGEPGAPDQLHFNDPFWHYLHGSSYTQGINTPWGRERTSSISPISTPYDLMKAVEGTARGKQGPFDYQTQTIFDEAAPWAKAAINTLRGEGAKGKGGWGAAALANLESLFPDYKFVQGLVHPKSSASYPGDNTWQGRLRREFGIIPIPVNDAHNGQLQTGPLKSTGSSGGYVGGIGGGSGGGGYVGGIP